MPLSMRPWSINCYVLSKEWFRCGSVDLKVSDLSASSSSVKPWGTIWSCHLSSYLSWRTWSNKCQIQGAGYPHQNIPRNCSNPKIQTQLAPHPSVQIPCAGGHQHTRPMVPTILPCYILRDDQVFTPWYSSEYSQSEYWPMGETSNRAGSYDEHGSRTTAVHPMQRRV